MIPRDIAARLCVQLVLGVALLLVGMWVGHDIAETRAAVAREKALVAAHKRYQEALDDGAERVAHLTEQQRLQNSHYATLDERQRHAPLIAPVRSACHSSDGIHAAAGLPGLVTHAAGAGSVVAAAGRDARGIHPGGGAADGADVAVRVVGEQSRAAGQLPDELAHEAAGPVLSLAAVSLWNSALAGADVSAGACRADALAEPACAAESGISLDDAWRNQRANAASCAADRARHQALIDFINRRAQQ